MKENEGTTPAAAATKAEAAPAVKQQTGRRKWLGRIGKFLMYGGWMLVLIVGITVYILISSLLSGR